MVWLELPVTFVTINSDIQDFAESRSNSGSVEVVGSIPIGSTLRSLGKHAFCRGFLRFVTSNSSPLQPLELSRLGSFEGTLTVKPILVPLRGLQQKVYLDPIDFEQPHQPKQPLANRPFR